jgi:hypothetical protein
MRTWMFVIAYIMFGALAAPSDAAVIFDPRTGYNLIATFNAE